MKYVVRGLWAAWSLGLLTAGALLGSTPTTVGVLVRGVWVIWSVGLLGIGVLLGLTLAQLNVWRRTSGPAVAPSQPVSRPEGWESDAVLRELAYAVRVESRSLVETGAGR